MKNSFKWMSAAILICGLSFSIASCKKDPQPTPTPTPDPEPITRTMLTGIVATGVSFYDSVTYTYNYDAEYRISRSESHVTNEDFVIHDLHFDYSAGHISVAGTENESPVTIECTLDDQGRITHYVKTHVINDTVTDITNADFTYVAEGHLVSEYKISNDANAQGVTVNFVWEGDELKARNTEGDIITIDYVASDAPAQALFSIIGYDIFLEELCAQGCFGKLPAHMPAQETITTAIPIPGMDPLVVTTNYTYTINADGRLATCVETGGANDETTNYTFIWEER